MNIVPTRGLAPYDLLFVWFELCEANRAVARDFFAVVWVRGRGVGDLGRGEGRGEGEDFSEFLLNSVSG